MPGDIIDSIIFLDRVTLSKMGLLCIFWLMLQLMRTALVRPVSFVGAMMRLDQTLEWNEDVD